MGMRALGFKFKFIFLTNASTVKLLLIQHANFIFTIPDILYLILLILINSSNSNFRIY